MALLALRAVRHCRRLASAPAGARLVLLHDLDWLKYLNHSKYDNMTQECVDLIDLDDRKQEYVDLF